MPSDERWRPQPDVIPALVDDVHVWRVDLSRPATPDLAAGLSEVERAQERRFRRDLDRQSYVQTRVALRSILARYLGVQPRSILFSTSRWGKPALAGHGSCRLHFNTSHSGSVTLIAVAAVGEVGIDVEEIRAEYPGRDVALRVFSAREQAALGELPDDLRLAGFFTGWVRKEAFIKGIGEGMHFGLKRFDVALDPRTPAALLAAPDGLTSRWCIHDLPPIEGYASALAAPSTARRVRCFGFSS